MAQRELWMAGAGHWRAVTKRNGMRRPSAHAEDIGWRREAIHRSEVEAIRARRGYKDPRRMGWAGYIETTPGWERMRRQRDGELR